MKNPVEKSNILLGVCAGIALYKSAYLVRALRAKGFAVKVMMTKSATEFIRPLLFKYLSQNPVYLEMFEPKADIDIEHISLTQWADICLIAPCSANTLSKIATGICDNLLTTVVCAKKPQTPLIIAPGMNECMWQNPIIQNHVKTLSEISKYEIMTPQKGELACGSWGQGRMPETEDIILRVIKALPVK